MDSHKPVQRPTDNRAEGSGSSSRRIGAARRDPVRQYWKGAALVCVQDRENVGRSGDVLWRPAVRQVLLCIWTSSKSIPRPRMDYRCSMSPRFSPTTCDNPVVTEYCGVWLRLAHCQLDLAGHRSRRPRHSEPNENWLLVRACDRLLDGRNLPASVSRIKTSMSAEAAIA